MKKRKPHALTARHLAPIRRAVKTLERTRIAIRADVNHLEIQVYDLTSRIAALERKDRNRCT